MKILNKDMIDNNHYPDAILFDTDNCLYNYNEANKIAMKVVRDKVCKVLSIDSNQFERIFNEAKAVVKKRLKNTASSHNRLLYFQTMLEMIGLGSQVLLALDFEQTYWRTLLANAQLFEGVTELLDTIRIADIPTAIVTDLTANIQFRKIIYFGLDKYFDHIVTSEEAGCDKPDPAPFKLALEKIKPKGNCIWMVGDNPLNDIAGAKHAIGAITIQKIHSGVEVGQNDEAPDMIINHFKELRVFLEGMKKPIGNHD